MGLGWITRLSSVEERPWRARFVLTFAGLVIGWAVLHDLYLMHVEPRHFTDYHRDLLPITNLSLLAVQYAVVATTGPGLVFGFLAHAACRGGYGQPVKLKWGAAGFGGLMVVIEIVLLSLGHWSLERFQAGLGPLYPTGLYPDFTDGIILTQTVNISAYLLAPLSGALYLTALWWWRRRRA